MAETIFSGNPIPLTGDLPTIGSTAPAFNLLDSSLAEVSSNSLAGQRVVLNIFPSIDTPTCATSVRTFNQRAGEAENTAVVCVSADLPFAAGRFCGAEGISNVTTGSTFRSPDFASAYGVEMAAGPLAGLCARAVVVLDTDGTVLHTELVEDISNEPNYDAALNSLVSTP